PDPNRHYRMHHHSPKEADNHNARSSGSVSLAFPGTKKMKHISSVHRRSVLRLHCAGSAADRTF
ncbi:MAG TPA: hypothetical protein PKE16_04170, partial [Hyphomicrobium sp.]|nr:hypothetical protein [Hyphomicrobium sp.]